VSCRLIHGALRRGGAPVLAPAELVIPAGARVAVIGANGAGKSTLFLALTGVLRTRGGTARITGPVSNPGTTFMPQQPALPRWLNVGEAIELYGGAQKSREEMTAALHLQELLRRRVGSLSGGEAQAVMLAATVARGGDVLILDEPFAHLDFRRRLAAIELMRNDRSSRLLTLVSSQNAADLVPFCDWYVVLARGRSVFCGSSEDLLGAPAAVAESGPRLETVEARLLALLEESPIAH
jgi:ABC-type multidrug transport system ATPase subunit